MPKNFVHLEIKGDLIALAKLGNFDIIAHGCNCHKLMGAGLAAQVAVEIPEAVIIDKASTRTPTQRLGDMTSVELMEFTFLNLYTQFNPGPALDYVALTMCLRKVNMLYPGKHIGLPQIGCGIAGGDWIVVKQIIDHELTDMDVTIVHYKK